MAHWLPLVTSTILAIIGVLSFIINSKYTHDNTRVAALLRQRESIRAYGVSMIDVMQVFVNVEIEYLKERRKLEDDLSKGIQIKPDRSQYVYQLKKDVKAAEVSLKAKVWNANIEISKLEFGNTQKTIFDTFRKITVITKNMNIDQQVLMSEKEIDILETQLNAEIQRLLRQFVKAQDNLTHEIQTTDLFARLTRPFRKHKH